MKRLLIPIFLLFLISNSLTAQDTKDVPSSARRIKPVAVGDILPSYPLTDTKYETIDLYSYLEEQPIILIYYRGGW